MSQAAPSDRTDHDGIKRALADITDIALAVGVIVAEQNVSPDAARSRLAEIAAARGLSPADAARELLDR